MLPRGGNHRRVRHGEINSAVFRKLLSNDSLITNGSFLLAREGRAINSLIERHSNVHFIRQSRCPVIRGGVGVWMSKKSPTDRPAYESPVSVSRSIGHPVSLYQPCSPPSLSSSLPPPFSTSSSSSPFFPSSTDAVPAFLFFGPSSSHPHRPKAAHVGGRFSLRVPRFFRSVFSRELYARALLSWGPASGCRTAFRPQSSQRAGSTLVLG